MLTGHPAHQYHQIKSNQSIKGSMCGNLYVAANKLISILSDYPTPNPSSNVDSQPSSDHFMTPLFSHGSFISFDAINFSFNTTHILFAITHSSFDNIHHVIHPILLLVNVNPPHHLLPMPIHHINTIISISVVSTSCIANISHPHMSLYFEG
jgi:hypothetical protein